jgi:hypothetical protein
MADPVHVTLVSGLSGTYIFKNEIAEGTFARRAHRRGHGQSRKCGSTAGPQPGIGGNGGTRPANSGRYSLARGTWRFTQTRRTAGARANRAAGEGFLCSGLDKAFVGRTGNRYTCEDKGSRTS